MSDRYDDHPAQEPPDELGPARTSKEGVRIIGAEEAATALETGQASGRRPDDAPRFGDVPEPPQGPRPPLRFPLSDADDPASVAPKPPPAGGAPPPVRRGDFARPYTAPKTTPPPVASEPPDPPPVSVPSSPPATALPHWSEPATGEVPRILPGAAEGDEADQDEDDLGAWASLSGGPRWRDQAADWADADFADDTLTPGDDVRVGALDDDRPPPDDLYDFEAAPADATAAEEAPRKRRQTISLRSRHEPSTNDEIVAAPAPRDVPVAVATGLAIGLVFLLFAKQGPGLLLVLVGAVVVLAAAEMFNSIRVQGHQPATLLGLVTTVALLGAAYRNGTDAYPLVLGMFIVFGLLWYLAGVVRARPAVNVGLSLLVVAYVGFLGSFAALLLKFPARDGVAFLVGMVIDVVAYDVGAFFVGRRFGRTPLAPDISPNKTWEGLLGASGAALLAALVIVRMIHPWSRHAGWLWLAIVVWVAAPLGDLCESMIKRDMGVKDMGSILPGHGGVLDRVDAMLFVLPATYYLVRLLKIG